MSGNKEKTSKSINEARDKDYSKIVVMYIHMSLQLECYADDTGDESVFDTPGFKTLGELRENYDNLTFDERFEKAELVLKQFNDTIDKLGRDKFITYEDGDVEYIWKYKGQKKK